MPIAQKLLKLRESSNLTQSQLANKLFISQQTYSRYETGLTEPTISTLQKIADFYCIPLNYFSESNQHDYSTIFILSNEEIETLKKAKKIIEKIIDFKAK